MKKIKVMSVFGTRPEASKMCPVIKVLEKSPHIISSVLVTAQHRSMLDQMLDVFKVSPDFDLDIMTPRQTSEAVMVKVLEGVCEILRSEKPDLILVHGDTTTTYAAALAGFYCGVKVGHIEAGLRSFNKFEPYPEEMNRTLVTRLADINFAPTGLSKVNLINENIDSNSIYVTGNTAVDCLKYSLSENYAFENEVLRSIDFDNKKIIAMTAHRGENLGEPLENICRAIRTITQEHDNVEVVYAVHLNPAVQETANRILGDLKNVHLIDPLNMVEMHNLMRRSSFIMTDSGGLQEEGPAMNKPVVVLRNVTERPEGLSAGTLVLAGTDETRIFNVASELITNAELYNLMAFAKNPYGDGCASERILNGILHYFGIESERPIDFE
jgi:UDP-N-acetylglucosamine 2-epimerase (non-hydrolysing)